MYNGDDEAGGKRALTNCTLDGTNHSSEEIAALMLPQVRWGGDVLGGDDQLKAFHHDGAWATMYQGLLDLETNETLDTRATGDICDPQRASTLRPHPRRLEPQPDSQAAAEPEAQHAAKEQVPREQGEAFHTAQGDFATGKMRSLMAQLLNMEGAVRFSKRHDDELQY